MCIRDRNICYFFQEKSHSAIIPRAKSCILHYIITCFIVMQHYSDCDNKFHDATYSSSASSTASCSHNKLTSILCFYSAPLGERMYCDQFFCLYVCLSVCLPRAYLWNRWTDLHEIFYADPLWPWLGPPLAALRYQSGVWYLWMLYYRLNWGQLLRKMIYVVSQWIT